MWRPVAIFLAFSGLTANTLMLLGELFNDWLAKQWYLTFSFIAAVTGSMFIVLLCDYLVSRRRLSFVHESLLVIDGEITWAGMLGQSRAMATLIGVVLVVAALGTHVFLTETVSSEVLFVASLAVGFACFDLFLLSWRASRGSFGNNRAEAEELLRFVSRHGGGTGPKPRHAIHNPMGKPAIRPDAHAVGGH